MQISFCSFRSVWKNLCLHKETKPAFRPFFWCTKLSPLSANLSFPHSATSTWSQVSVLPLTIKHTSNHMFAHMCSSCSHLFLQLEPRLFCFVLARQWKKKALSFPSFLSSLVACQFLWLTDSQLPLFYCHYFPWGCWVIWASDITACYYMRLHISNTGKLRKKVLEGKWLS